MSPKSEHERVDDFEARLLAEQKRHNEEFRQFAYAVSHDLREPVRMIASYTQLLERRYQAQFDSDGLEFMRYIVDATQRMDRPQEVENLPIRKVNSDSTLLLRDVATVSPGTTPGEIDRSAMHRYLSITANLEGNDLGGAARDIQRAIDRAGEPPRGVQVSVRGQVAPMTEMFLSLTIGLALSVVVIQVLLTGYFQSFRVALVSIGGVPGVVLGVATMLWLFKRRGWLGKRRG